MNGSARQGGTKGDKGRDGEKGDGGKRTCEDEAREQTKNCAGCNVNHTPV